MYGWFVLVHPRHTPPLWIADQVRNDVGVVAGRYSAWRVTALWFPAFAGMTVRGAGNDSVDVIEFGFERFCEILQ